MADNNQQPGNQNQPEGGNNQSQGGNNGAGTGGQSQPEGGSGNDGRTFSQEDLNAVVAREVERQQSRQRQELAQRLGVPIDQLDQELERAAEARKNQMSELEKTQAELERLKSERDTALSQANERLLQAEIMVQAREMGFVDADDAFRLLDREGVTIEDGKVSGVEDALKSLAEAKPHLLGQGTGGPAKGGSDFDGGAANNAGTYEQQIAEAEANGDFEKALSLKNEWFNRQQYGDEFPG